MSGISSKSAGGLENKKKYNGIEYESSFDLNIGEAFFRTHDPQLGRWWQIDPKPDYSESPYSAMSNNPLLRSDPLGDKDSTANKPKVVIVPIPQKIFPNIYKNLLKSLASGKPMTITYDANRQNARQRRREALKNTPPKPGSDRDEYPYASTKEGGKGADVNYVPTSENRKHGGFIGALVVANNMQTGDQFQMVPIPDTPDGEPETSPSPVTSPVTVPATPIITPKQVATGAGVAVGLYILWKVIEGVATIPVCGGCGALSPL
jgi:RHS repeat-associated protein